MFGPPSSVAGVFMPSTLDAPMRNSSSDVGSTVQVIPFAVCQFIMRLTIPAPCPDGPGIPLLGAASWYSSRSLNREKAVILLLTYQSPRMSPLLLVSVAGKRAEKLLTLPGRLGAGRALNTVAPNCVICDAGIVLLG